MNFCLRAFPCLPLALSVLAPPLPAQMVSRLQYGIPPLVFASSYGPSVVGPPACTLMTPGFCTGIIPPVNGGIFPPPPNAIGGLAVDHTTGTLYTTDGALAIAAEGYDLTTSSTGCGAGFVFPLAAWPASVTTDPGTGLFSPIVGMCDAAEPFEIWVMNAAGVVSRIPFPPGPPTAQGLAPVGILPDMATGNVPTGITFDPFSGFLWFVCANTLNVPPLPSVGVIGTPAFTGILAPPASLPSTLVVPVPCPPSGINPAMDITVNKTVLPGLLPDLVVLFYNGQVCDFATAPVYTAGCLPQAGASFVDAPHIFGSPVACGPHIGWAGGFPVVGNAAFTVAAGGISSSSFAALLVAALAPAWPLPIYIPPWTIWLDLTSIIAQIPTVVFPGFPGPCQGATGLTLPIPPNPGLAGFTLYFQWVTFPSNTPGLPFDVSDGMEVRVGMP